MILIFISVIFLVIDFRSINLQKDENNHNIILEKGENNYNIILEKGENNYNIILEKRITYESIYR